MLLRRTTGTVYCHCLLLLTVTGKSVSSSPSPHLPPAPNSILYKTLFFTSKNFFLSPLSFHHALLCAADAAAAVLTSLC